MSSGSTLGLGLAAVLAIADMAAAQAPLRVAQSARAGRKPGTPAGRSGSATVLYLSLDRGVAGGGRSVAILTNLERVRLEMLALARRVAGLWPLAAAPTASEAARRPVSRHF